MKQKEYRLSLLRGAVSLCPEKPPAMVQNEPGGTAGGRCVQVHAGYTYTPCRGGQAELSMLCAHTKWRLCSARGLFAQTNTTARFNYSLRMALEQNANAPNWVLMRGSHPRRRFDLNSRRSRGSCICPNGK